MAASLLALTSVLEEAGFSSLEEAGFSSLEEELLCEEETGFSSLEDAAEEAGFSTLEELPALSEVPFEEEEAGFSSLEEAGFSSLEEAGFSSLEEDVSSLEDAGLSSLEEALELLELLDEEELVLGVSSVVQPPVQPVIPTARTRTAAVSRTANRFIFI